MRSYNSFPCMPNLSSRAGHKAVFLSWCIAEKREHITLHQAKHYTGCWREIRQPVHHDRPDLAQPMGSSLGLQVVVGIPVTVKNEDCVCCHQIDAQASRPSAQQEAGIFSRLPGESVYAGLTVCASCQGKFERCKGFPLPLVLSFRAVTPLKRF